MGTLHERRRDDCAAETHKKLQTFKRPTAAAASKQARTTITTSHEQTARNPHKLVSTSQSANHLCQFEGIPAPPGAQVAGAVPPVLHQKVALTSHDTRNL